MSDAFDSLERELRAATRAAAADTATPKRRGRWRRTGPLAAVAAALVVSGGAFAAVTQLLEVGEPIEDPTFHLNARPNEGAGLVQGDARLLPLRVADPGGGPPWALRVFTSTRGMSCVQVGRVYSGRFGLVRADTRTGREVAFREIRALPGANSTCGGASRNGFPVLRGLRRVEMEGGVSDPRRCGPGRGGRCPIENVRVLRYGLLGPAARAATYVDGSGRARARARLSAENGGAYLFVVPEDPAPYRRFDTDQRAWIAALGRARKAGMSAREALAEVDGRRSGPWPESPPRDGVVARFTDGRELRVAGRGRFAGALPGVARKGGRLPDARTRLDVQWRGSGDTQALTVAFAAPVRIARADHGYRARVEGPDGKRCDKRLGGYDATTRDIRRGERVSFDVEPRSGYDRRTWCPGTFTVRVTYAAGRRETLVGTTQFTVPR